MLILGPYQPPSDVQLVDVRPGQLTFSWSSVPDNCAAIHYNIIAMNCRIMCPSTTTHNTITCTGPGGILSSTPCIFAFAVQTVVCDGVIGNASNPVSVTLKGTWNS